MFSFFTYSLKNLSQSQKSLEEYFSTPFKCIYSIYIHSWAHEWRPFRKAFLLIVWKECLTSIIHFPHMASRSAAAYWTLVSANQTLPKNILIPVQTLTFLSSNSFNTECCQLILNFMAQEVMSELCAAGILHPSHHTFGLIQLRCRLTHTKAIYTGKCDMTKKSKTVTVPLQYKTKASHFMARDLICSRPGRDFNVSFKCSSIFYLPLTNML